MPGLLWVTDSEIQNYQISYGNFLVQISLAIPASNAGGSASEALVDDIS
jgi:hypothetical protein